MCLEFWWLFRPLSKVTHVRVLGEKQLNPLTIEDIDLYEVIDGIVDYLEKNKPDFANLSLGPDTSVDDNEVSYWTARLDKYASENSTLITVAAGNNGNYSDLGNLNRVQIPSDAVNILSVGSADNQGDNWNRATYSAIGPGRNPGIIKPDILCFGGSEEQPFYVLALHNGVYKMAANAGTSFAAPLAMRQAARIYGDFKDSLNLLSIRAILIHQAQNNNLDCKEVGWGKCNEDSNYLITCEDNEITVVYNDVLDISQYTRLPLPLSNVTLDCEIEVKSTIVAKTEVDPSFSATYTKSGFEVVFRPDSQNIDEDSQYQYPKSKAFFKNMLPPLISETMQKAKGAKWECVRREEITLRKFHTPVCDIVSHHRDEGKNEIIKHPIEISCIITIRAKKGVDLYNRVIRSYQGVLLPISPRITTQIKL